VLGGAHLNCKGCFVSVAGSEARKGYQDE